MNGFWSGIPCAAIVLVVTAATVAPAQVRPASGALPLYEPQVASRSPTTARPGSELLGKTRAISYAPQISPEFRKRTQAAFASIPDPVWRGIFEAGWQVRLAEYVVDAAPSLKGTQPRGWPAGTTWENTDAVHLPDERLLVFAEKRRNRRGASVPTVRVEGVIRHEVGHAFDQACGGQFRFRSSSSSFLVAYHRDLAKLSSSDRAALEYYLQNSQAGRQEAFAEAFGVLLGGGSDGEHEERFTRAFPNVLRYVEQAMREF